MVEFTILGQCYSLKNTRTVFPVKPKFSREGVEIGAKCPHCRRAVHMMTIPNDKAELFELEFKRQLPTQARQRIPAPVHVDMEIYYPTNMQDLDEALVLDLCQKYGVIENDRQVVSKFIRKHIDKQSPRVIVRITPVTWNRDGKQPGLLDDQSESPIGAIA